jgi:hypothetical protein
MQHATEMAVMSSIQHPNVVAVYSCLTDMVEVALTGWLGHESGGLRLCRWSSEKQQWLRLSLSSCLGCFLSKAAVKAGY